MDYAKRKKQNSLGKTKILRPEVIVQKYKVPFEMLFLVLLTYHYFQPKTTYFFLLPHSLQPSSFLLVSCRCTSACGSASALVLCALSPLSLSLYVTKCVVDIPTYMYNVAEDDTQLFEDDTRHKLHDNEIRKSFMFFFSRGRGGDGVVPLDRLFKIYFRGSRKKYIYWENTLRLKKKTKQKLDKMDNLSG